MTKIIEAVDISHFQKIVAKRKVRVSSHALDHLSEAQRNVFKPSELMKLLTEKQPRGVGLQKNGNYAAFYRKKSGFRTLIVAIKQERLDIVTFMDVDSMPNLKRLK